jgi:hypothetical protein
MRNKDLLLLFGEALLYASAVWLGIFGVVMLCP